MSDCSVQTAVAETHLTFEILRKSGGGPRGPKLYEKPELPREICEADCHKLQICEEPGLKARHTSKGSQFSAAVDQEKHHFHWAAAASVGPQRRETQNLYVCVHYLKQQSSGGLLQVSKSWSYSVA